MKTLRLASLWSRALVGADAVPVAVEVHLGNGLPQFQIVGQAESEVKESRDRVRVALQANGFEFPQRRITVNLAPADVPKRSGHFDLPIALGLLIASGQIPPGPACQLEFAGELGLDGRLRPVRGTLAMAHAAERGQRPLVVAVDSGAELALFELGNTRLARSLGEVIELLKGQRTLPAPGAMFSPGTDGHLGEPGTPDLADVRGQPSARDALVVAASGGHALLLLGPPGCGKTMLADRLHGLLPPMDPAEALVSAIQQSLAGQPIEPGRHRIRPLRRPHHTASMMALTGGGAPLRPGEISLAHAGVLMLDEIAEFSRSSLEALREPIESGEIHLARVNGSDVLPARFQLVATMNPCPCGRTPHGRPPCRCTTEKIALYRGRLSQPLLDRIDLWVSMEAISEEALTAPPAESTAQARKRVLRARERQLARQGALNAHLPLAALTEAAALSAATTRCWQALSRRHHWSARGALRVLAVARTLADLDQHRTVSVDHLYQAANWRRTY